MKAYTCTTTVYEDEITVFVDNPGEARAYTADVFGVRFIDTRVKRNPRRDRYARINGRGPWDEYVMDQYFDDQKAEWLYEMQRERELCGW